MADGMQSRLSLWEDPLYTKSDAVRWAVSIAIAAVDVLWIVASHRSVSPAGLIARAQILALIAVAVMLLKSIRQVRHNRGAEPIIFSRQIELFFHAALFWSFTSATLALFSYLLITLNPPIMDFAFDAIDKSINFDWLALFLWVQQHSFIKSTLQIAYESAGLQSFFITVLFCLTVNVRKLNEFLSNIMVSLLLIFAISAPFPAHSAWVYYGVASMAQLNTLSHFDALREGTLQVFNLRTTQTLVSLPSFHTSLAILFVYVLRSSPFLFPFAILLNCCMVFSTLTEGGHYLVDIMSGALVTVLSIAIVRALSGKLKG